MNRYAIAPLARADLDEIWTYVARESLSAADRLIALFYQKFSLLASQPLLGEPREVLQPSLRAFCVGNYLILYRLKQNNGIEIVRVIHSARDIGSQF